MSGGEAGDSTSEWSMVDRPRPWRRRREATSSLPSSGGLPIMNDVPESGRRGPPFVTDQRNARYAVNKRRNINVNKNDEPNNLPKMNDRNVPRRRVPRSAVVSIRGIQEGFSYTDAMRKAKEGISLKDLGINNTRIKKAAGGSLLIEVPGPNGGVHADKLKNELIRVLGEAAVVTRPVVRGDIRVIGVDESVTSKEVAMVMAEVGGCLAEEVTVSPMRPMKNGLYMV